MVVEERLGPVELGSALSEYPSFAGSFRYRGLLYGLCSLLDPSVEPGRVVSDLRLFRPSTLPGRYRGVVVVRSPEQGAWLAKKLPGGECLWIVPASHPCFGGGVPCRGLAGLGFLMRAAGVGGG